MTTARESQSGCGRSAALCRGGLFLGLLLFGMAGCSTPPTVEDRYRASLDSYTRTIPEIVRDEERAGRLRDIGNNLFQDLRADAETLETLVERVDTLNRNFDTSREDLEQSLAEVDRHRQLLQDRLVAARTEAVRLTTEEEWVALTARESTLLSVIQEDWEQQQGR